MVTINQSSKGEVFIIDNNKPLWVECSAELKFIKTMENEYLCELNATLTKDNTSYAFVDKIVLLNRKEIEMVNTKYGCDGLIILVEYLYAIDNEYLFVDTSLYKLMRPEYQQSFESEMNNIYHIKTHSKDDAIRWYIEEMDFEMYCKRYIEETERNAFIVPLNINDTVKMFEYKFLIVMPSCTELIDADSFTNKIYEVWGEEINKYINRFIEINKDKLVEVDFLDDTKKECEQAPQTFDWGE